MNENCSYVRVKSNEPQQRQGGVKQSAPDVVVDGLKDEAVEIGVSGAV